MNPQPYTSFPLAFSLALCQYVVMVCLYCSDETNVVNSRLQKRINNVWRRRSCSRCKAIFTTIESPDLSNCIQVRYKDGHVGTFDRDKLLLSIAKALEHRPDNTTAASYLCGTVISLLLSGQSARLEASAIAATAHTVLMRFDAASATIYGAYHPSHTNSSSNS